MTDGVVKERGGCFWNGKNYEVFLEKENMRSEE